MRILSTLIQRTFLVPKKQEPLKTRGEQLIQGEVRSPRALLGAYTGVQSLSLEKMVSLLNEQEYRASARLLKAHHDRRRRVSARRGALICG